MIYEMLGTILIVLSMTTIIFVSIIVKQCVPSKVRK